MTSAYNGRLTAARSWFLGAALTAMAAFSFGCGRDEASAPTADAAAKKEMPAASAFESADQRVSYGIGYNVGSNVARQGGLTVDQAAIVAGIEDGLKRIEPRISQEDLQAAFATVQERAQAAFAKESEANLTAANAFLAENRQKPGVKVTDSGLQYEVLQPGTGPKPKATDTVEVHYHGTLPDGTVFDSSVERGEPIQFPVTGVIPGWVEGLQMMSVGGKWRLVIPPNLGYGPRATGKIPANSALIFEVELLGIK